MTAAVARVLLVADTHLGFDLPFRPRVQRRRRGPDFFANLDQALAPALAGTVDAVVHGGDLFYRSKVPSALIEMAMAPLLRVAEAGVPVFLVPGNHERSRIPLHLWAAHPKVHLFDQPRTFLCRTPAGRLALSGFPFARRVREAFRDLVQQTRCAEVDADAHLLCLHQTVEGAQVGPSDYTFRSGPDVIRGKDVPSGFSAVLAGHIHRAQALTHDPRGRPLGAPIVYPGSVERTSFAERNEAKAYAVLTIGLSGQERNQLLDVAFIPLPARPMVRLALEPTNGDRELFLALLARRLRALCPDAVVRIHVRGPHAEASRQLLTAATLRNLAPPTMNVSVAPEHYRRRTE